MEKDRIICLLFCGGADGAGVFVNGKYAGTIESMSEFPELLETITYLKQHIGTVIYTIDDDNITDSAFDGFHNSESDDLTQEEENAIIEKDYEKFNKLWEER